MASWQRICFDLTISAKSLLPHRSFIAAEAAQTLSSGSPDSTSLSTSPTSALVTSPTSTALLLAWRASWTPTRSLQPTRPDKIRRGARGRENCESATSAQRQEPPRHGLRNLHTSTFIISEVTCASFMSREHARDRHLPPRNPRPSNSWAAVVGGRQSLPTLRICDAATQTAAHLSPEIKTKIQRNSCIGDSCGPCSVHGGTKLRWKERWPRRRSQRWRSGSSRAGRAPRVGGSTDGTPSDRSNGMNCFGT